MIKIDTSTGHVYDLAHACYKDLEPSNVFGTVQKMTIDRRNKLSFFS
jgi:hypothetical protein